MEKSAFDRREAMKFGLIGGAAAAAAGISFVGKAEAQASGESTLQKVLASKELKVGVIQGEPWFAKDQRSGEWSGVGWGVAVALAAELDVKPVAVETTWANAVAGLQAGQYDLMCVLDATPKRAMAVDFPTQPLLHYAMGVLVRDGLSVTNWSDLNQAGIKVGVTQGSTGDRDMTALIDKGEVSRFPSNDEATAAFQSGRIDALALFHPTLVMQRSKVNMGTVVLPLPIRAQASSVGVRRETDKAWRDWVGLAIDYLYATGRTQAIYEQHLTSRGIDPKSAPAVSRDLWAKA